MTTPEKIERIRLLSNNSLGSEYTDEVLEVFIETAKTEILSRLYNGITEVPMNYENLQCMSVIVGINQIGAEGSKSYNSNGMSRNFSYETMLKYIKSNMPAKVRVI